MEYKTYDLLRASLGQSVADVKKVLDSGIGINSCDEPGRETALMVAAGGGNLEVVTFLVESGANINQKSGEGSTAIMPAILKEHGKVLQYLLSKGAQINYQTTSGFKFSPLQLACQLGHTDMARNMIEAGANVNSVAGDGSTPLISAIFKGHIDVVKLLLENGANKNYMVNKMNASGFAEHFGRTSIKEFIDSHISKTPSGNGCLLFLIAPLVGLLSSLVFLWKAL